MNLFFSELYGSGYWIRSHKALKLAKLVEVFFALLPKGCLGLCAARQESIPVGPETAHA